MSDDELDRLNETYRYDGLVFVRKRKIGVYWRGTDGEPTGKALMRFDNIEDAEEWAWSRAGRGKSESADVCPHGRGPTADSEAGTDIVGGHSVRRVTQP